MDSAQYLAAIRRDSSALLDAARACDPTASVDGCPEWTPIDLVWHIGRVHWLWATVVEERLTDRQSYVEPERPASAEEVFAFADRAARRLLDVLAAVDPATPVWTWSRTNNAGWVIRRMAHETAVHRGDAERTAGREYRIEAELAADGVDEFLTDFLVRVDEQAPPAGGSVHLHCTDTAGEWTVTPAEDGSAVVTREHGKGDAAMRGAAHDLLMVLWHRAPLDTVEVFGDAAVAERFVARFKL